MFEGCEGLTRYHVKIYFSPFLYHLYMGVCTRVLIILASPLYTSGCGKESEIHLPILRTYHKAFLQQVWVLPVGDDVFEQ